MLRDSVDPRRDHWHTPSCHTCIRALSTVDREGPREVLALWDRETMPVRVHRRCRGVLRRQGTTVWAFIGKIGSIDRGASQRTEANCRKQPISRLECLCQTQDIVLKREDFFCVRARKSFRFLLILSDLSDDLVGLLLLLTRLRLKLLLHFGGNFVEFGLFLLAYLALLLVVLLVPSFGLINCLSVQSLDFCQQLVDVGLLTFELCLNLDMRVF